jgi:TolB-like protein/Tfp pilus assembly protein PilF
MRVLSFGQHKLDLRRGALLSSDGSEIPLRPKAFELLELLVENAGSLLSRDTIMQSIWPDVVVTDDNITQCIHDIRRALGPQTAVLLRSVPRRGYIFEVEVTQHAAPPVAAVPSNGRAVQKPSITVLPFANLSGRADQEYFADGVAEGITTELARSRSLFVISRDSSLGYRGTSDVDRVAEELGVRYVLRGSVRRGERIHVTAQLIDAQTGIHLWADRYDREVSDVFIVQDSIARAVALAIEPTIATVELQRALRRPPGSLDAWEEYQRGLWHQSLFDVHENLEARRCFEQAVALDPTFSGAWRGLVHTYVDENRLFFTRGLAQTISATAPLARKAVEADPGDPESQAGVGWVSLTQGDVAAALEAADVALALNPNCADAYRLKGTALIYSGKPSDGCEVLSSYWRLSPRDPRGWQASHMIAMGRYLLGDYAGSVDAAKRAMRANARQPLSYRWLAAALGQLSRKGEALTLMAHAPVAVAPLSMQDYLCQRWPWQRQEDHDHMLDGLVRAGWLASPVMPQPPLR